MIVQRALVKIVMSITVVKRDISVAVKLQPGLVELVLKMFVKSHHAHRGINPHTIINSVLLTVPVRSIIIPLPVLVIQAMSITVAKWGINAPHTSLTGRLELVQATFAL